ncbi:unnamed protein product [Medioppia subpectinata]|uniref:Uncharacterized protein n=1 Tax=Medioppia subpectinata TaxID=1979941 RepID=A0A7R9PTK2_9ACAR|nr:unnamed protein product [Medioppia subpectinata]CAG2100592.1 unnamed protein product [Medioppia subpectinata]
MSFKSKSLKSNSSLNHSRGHLTGGQHIQHIQQLSQSVSKCIAQDLSLLRPHIQWTPMSHPMPEMTKNAKNQTITEEQLLSDMSEMDTKLDQLKRVIEDEAIPINDMHFESLSDECNELKTSLPTFRRVVNTFIDKYENQSRDESICFDRKAIELEEEKVEKMLRLSQQIQHFQQTNKHLNSFNNQK